MPTIKTKKKEEKKQMWVYTKTHTRLKQQSSKEEKSLVNYVEELSLNK